MAHHVAKFREAIPLARIVVMSTG